MRRRRIVVVLAVTAAALGLVGVFGPPMTHDQPVAGKVMTHD